MKRISEYSVVINIDRPEDELYVLMLVLAIDAVKSSNAATTAAIN